MDVPLNFNRRSRDNFEREGSLDSFSLSETAELISAFVRRQFPIFVFILACAIALGLVYLFTTPASYTSHSMLLIDSSKVRILQQEAALGDVPIDTAQVETQVEVLKSENIGLSVIKDLKLTEDPEFAGSGGGLVGGILGLFVSSKAQSETGLTRQALATFLAKRSINRVGRTYVLDIGYTSLNPTRSANVANAIADAYIVDQLESKYQATRRASGWLQDRIKELRKQASDADRAVLDYKEKNNIVAVGGGMSSGSGPRLLGEQQLEELNSQLGSARSAAEEAKARLERITEVLKKDVPEATVTDSLHSEVINRLRSNYLDIAAKEAIWSARYGPNHLAAVNLRTQMAELRRSILDELGRIAQGYKSDNEIAKTRVDALERNLQSLVANSQVINRDRLGLTDLESTAKVYHTIYDNFLQRYMEAIQQQSFPITEARIISAAAPAERKSSPLTFNVLGIAAAIGLDSEFRHGTSARCHRSGIPDGASGRDQTPGPLSCSVAAARSFETIEDETFNRGPRQWPQRIGGWIGACPGRREAGSYRSKTSLWRRCLSLHNQSCGGVHRRRAALITWNKPGRSDRLFRAGHLCVRLSTNRFPRLPRLFAQSRSPRISADPA